MGLYEKLEQDMKNALKSRDAGRLSTLRMLVCAIKVFALEKNIKAVQDPDVLAIIQRQVKQHKESIEQFTKGSREDLVAKEAAELKVLESYLPKQLTDEELLGIVKDSIAKTGAVMKSDVGKVMKDVMEKVKGQADGKTINQIAMRLLK